MEKSVEVTYTVEYDKKGRVVLTDAEYREYLDWIHDAGESPSNDALVEFMRGGYDGEYWWQHRLESTQTTCVGYASNLKVLGVEDY
jgi:hypothetical protein